MAAIFCAAGPWIGCLFQDIPEHPEYVTVTPVPIDAIPEMILKNPDPEPEQPKSWQPDQINESLLSSRVSDW